MRPSISNRLNAFALVALGLAIAGMGVYVANADDAPGAAAIGFLLMLAAVVLGVRAARNRLPLWAGRAALVIGVLVAAFAATLTHAVTVAGPPFAQPPEVTSVGSPPSPQYAAAVEQARTVARAAVVEQNLPGVSVAVGAGGTLVWAEGFGWRDVDTRTPMTPDTRFNIGTAASAITPAAAVEIGLPNTGTDPAAAWSPEHIGEPEEDFPLFAIVRHAILQPLGLAPVEYPLPGNRATFYVPKSDENDLRHGRRLMYMRDLACCAGGMAFYSTPSDLVRFAMATGADSVDGELAGGTVISLVTRPDDGIVVAVASNIAYADTAAVARGVAAVFSKADAR